MSKLTVEQKNIKTLFTEKNNKFLIPDYQRPYAWDEDNCQTLWDDIFSFSFPNNNKDAFKSEDEYFLGSIVTFKNENRTIEIIDGQQRLTTILLILRAFYDKFLHMEDQNSKSIRDIIEKCLWKTDEFDQPDQTELKIDSEVATDSDKEEFLELLKSGKVHYNSKSKYVNNFKFFQKKIDEFTSKFPTYCANLPARILGNCILLPIEAESQDTALRIFSTLNDRGLPLSDADIFKAQFYKYYTDKGQKDNFIEEWKNLEDISSKIFNPKSGSPLDELFTRYMYYLRASEGNRKTTVDALRKFFERNKYQYLKNDQTITDLKDLAIFWENIIRQNQDKFSIEVLKQLYVLNYAPNSMWEYITSVYFLKNRDINGNLDNSSFSNFLEKITGFIFAYAVTNPGVNALRSPIFDEMINIINEKNVTFEKYRFSNDNIKSIFENYSFTNGRPITRSLLTWYAFTFENQELLDINQSFQIEHIFAKKRQEMENTLKDPNNLDALGNKILLEESINIRASDYRFEDKQKIYSGENRRGKYKERSKVKEIQSLIEVPGFDEVDLIKRDHKIQDNFFSYLKKLNLMKQ